MNASAQPGGDGSRDQPFQKIQYAARIAVAGDTVHVLPGTYRERVMPEHGGTRGKPIVYRSEIPRRAILKGSDIWKPDWRDEGSGIYSGEVDSRMFTDANYVDGGNPYRIAYYWEKTRAWLPPSPFKILNWNLGQVFVDGRQLQETSTRKELALATNAWWYDPAEDRIFVRLQGGSPQQGEVEITTRRGVFRPLKKGLGYITIDGFVFADCANQFPGDFWRVQQNAESGMVGTRGGHHWVITNNVFRDAKSIGLTFGSAPLDNELRAQDEPPNAVTGFHRIEDNLFLDNGAVGAMGYMDTGVVFRHNIFEGNNALANTSWETGGIKTHFATNMLVIQNWFLDNQSQGIWLDNTWTSCRITRNIFAGNRGKDIFFEMNDSDLKTATVVDHNVFLPGRPSLRIAGQVKESWQPWFAAIYGHDADGVRITHNLFVGDGYGLYFRKMTNRKGGAAFIRATGNLYIGAEMTAACLPVNAPPTVRSNWFDANIYPTRARPFVATGWSVANTLSNGVNGAALNKLLNHASLKSAEKFPFGEAASAPAGFYLTLDQWRQGMGFDQSSRTADISFRFDRHTWVLNLNVPAAVLRVHSSVEPAFKSDFSGRSFSQAVPGPFANLKAGSQDIQLPRPDRLELDDPVANDQFKSYDKN